MKTFKFRLRIPNGPTVVWGVFGGGWHGPSSEVVRLIDSKIAEPEMSTGQVDCEGTEIWEGDTVIYDKKEARGRIVYTETGFYMLDALDWLLKPRWNIIRVVHE